MKERRAAAQMQKPDAPLLLRDLFLRTIILPAASIIAGYVALDSEMDPAPLMEALAARGHRIALPDTRRKNEPLTFQFYEPAQKAPTGVSADPTVLLVPLLAFDAGGNRLGRGGGHYDRTLAALRQRRGILAIGLAFTAQRVEKVPTDTHDAKLDKIITEVEVF